MNADPSSIETSAVQYSGPQDNAKEPGGAQADRDGGLQTNASSIYWAMHTLITNSFNTWIFGFPADVEIRHDSQVAVTMTELDANDRPFVGQATMKVFNVAPQADGNIVVSYYVGWQSPVRVRFNFIIVN